MVRVRAVWDDPEEPPIRWLTPGEVLEHIGDDRHRWYEMPMIERLEQMRVCPSGMVTSARTPGLQEAWDTVAIEGMAEQFSVLPAPGGLLDQDPIVLEAFAVIRAGRNAVQERRLRRAEQRAKGGG